MSSQDEGQDQNQPGGGEGDQSAYMPLQRGELVCIQVYE